VRRLLFLAGAIVFVDTMFFAALTPLLPHYAQRFHLSKAGAGFLQAAYPLGVLVGGIPSGLAAARLGVKPTALAGLLLLAATSVVFGLASSIVLLDAARLAQGVGSACAWTASLAWLVAAAPRKRRGVLIGTAMAVAIAGALFGPVLGGVAALTSTAAAFSSVAVLALAIASLCLATPAPPRRPGQSLRLFVAALAEPRLLAGVWLVALPALLFGTQSVLVPLDLSRLGFGALGIGSVFFLAAALEGAASPLIGRITDRYGRRPPLVAGLVGSAAGTALLPWPSWGPLLAGVAVLAALAFGAFWVPALSLLTETAEGIGLDLAWAFALVNLAWAPGQALGAAAGGALARELGDAVPYLALTALCLLTLAAVRRP
jgi:MFS family permease